MGSVRELRATVQISAPRDHVWKVLTDFDQWKSWNPMVNAASGSAVVTGKLNLTMRGPDGKDAMKYQASIIEAEAPKRFRWRATMMAGFMFTNDRVFELNEKDGGTQLHNIEEFSGLMVPLFWGKMQGFVVPMLEGMNKALKDKVEAKA